MYLRANPWQLAFEDDNAAAEKAAAEKAAAEKAAAEKAAAGNEKMFNQTEVNAMLAADRRKLQEKQRILVSELETMKKQRNLTDAQKDELQQRIEDLQSQYMTTEEKARQEAARKEKEYNQELKTAVEERDNWKTKHAQLVINTEIASASITHEAVQFEQIAALLSPNAKLAEKLDDEGQPTGNFEPKVSFDDADKDGKAITLELTVDEAVKRMRELPRYANLFRTDKRGGLGGSGSATPGKKFDLAKVARENPQEYRRLRKERPDLFD